MDLSAVYSKTSKGIRVLSGKSRALSSPLMRALALVDGKSTVAEILAQSDSFTEQELGVSLGELELEGCVRITKIVDPDLSWQDQGSFSAMEVAEVSAEDFHKLAADATTEPPTIPSAAVRSTEADETRARDAAEIQARAEAERNTLQETEARAAAERQVKEQAEQRAREKAEAKVRIDIERKAREEAEAAIAAERKARKEAEALAAAERKARKDAEAKSAIERKLRDEAEAQTRTEEAARSAQEKAEALAKAEAAAKALEIADAAVEAERQARLAAEAQVESAHRARAEAEARATEEANRIALEAAQAQADAAAKAIELADAAVEAERKARLAAEAQVESAHRARAEAEVRAAEEAHRIALEAAQAQAEAEQARELAAANAAQAARRQAELEEAAQAKAEAERQAREKAERQAEIERQAREEAEAKAAAERAARKAAEDKAKTERKAREQAEAIADAERKEAAKARASAARKANQEAKTQAKAEAREKANTAAQARAQATAEREAGKTARRQAAVATAAMSAEATPLPSKGHGGKLFKLACASFALICITLLVLIFADLGSVIPAARLASEKIHAKISIASVHIALLPEPHLALQGIKIDEAPDIQVGTILVFPIIDTLFKPQKALHRIEISTLSLPPERLVILKQWLAAAPENNALHLNAIHIDSLVLQLPGLEPLSADIALTMDDRFAGATLNSADDRLKAAVTPGEPVALAINASSWQPSIEKAPLFDELDAKATLKGNGLELTEARGRIYGGAFSGRARLDWSGPWKMAGDFTLEHADIAGMTPHELALAGTVDLKGNFAVSANALIDLLANPTLKASFTARDGSIGNISLARTLAQDTRDSGDKNTRFDKLNGVVELADGVYHFSQLRLANKQLNANGEITAATSGSLSGYVVADMSVASRQFHGKFKVAGDSRHPQLK